MKSRFTLRQRLLLLTAVAVLPAFVVIVANQLSARALRTADVHSYAQHMNDVVLGEIVRGMTGAATMMVAIGHAPALQPGRTADCAPYLASVAADIPSIVDIAVADATGRVYCSTGASDAAVLQSAMAMIVHDAKPGGLTLGRYVETPKGAVLPMGLERNPVNGQPGGYVVMNITLDSLSDNVRAATHGLDSSTVVTDGAGTVLATQSAPDQQPGRPVTGVLADYVHAPDTGVARVVAPDGSGRIMSYRPATGPLPVGIFFELPEAEMMAPIDHAALTNTLIALAGAAIAFLVAWLIGNFFIHRPVENLNRAVAARRAGDRAARTGLVSDNSEFGRLARAVDDLFDELDRREEAQGRAEEQRDLYAREVQHRVKNLLAIVQVIARQTLSRADATPEVRIFENRIDAIIRTNRRLLDQGEKAADLGALLTETVAPFVGSDSSHIAIAGPPLELRPRVALAVTMAVHELATNAVKYGALSVPDGRVDVSWRIDGDRLELNWIETGGPPVTPPADAGFGSVLISRSLEAETRGHVTTTYAPEGFRFSLDAPLASIGPLPADAGVPAPAPPADA